MSGQLIKVRPNLTAPPGGKWRRLQARFAARQQPVPKPGRPAPKVKP